jgi:hypothetical protein
VECAVLPEMRVRVVGDAEVSPGSQAIRRLSPVIKSLLGELLSDYATC